MTTKISQLPITQGFGWVSETQFNREAANVTGLRNGTSGQAYRVYNTWTDASNGEWGAQRWASNVLEIGAYANGTGTSRDLAIFTAGSQNWLFKGTTGFFVAASDNTYDIGVAGNRPRSLVLSGYVATNYTTQSGTTYTVSVTDSSIVLTAGTTITLTLPAAGSFTGRKLHLKTTGGGAVNSATSNVVALAGGAAAAAILATTAGKWAELQSDGTNWIVMSAN